MPINFRSAPVYHLGFFFILLFSNLILAAPNNLTLQSRISKPDNNGYLEAAAVQFRFTITDPVGTCVIFQEDFANVDMTNSKGLISFKLGSGSKIYPAGAMTMSDIFTNFASPIFNCQAGGTYTAAGFDPRKVIMQFNDGAGWQTVPSMEINSVPFALESLSSQKLGTFYAADYVRTAQFTTCNPGEAVHFNGTAFSCTTSGITNGGNTGVMTIGTNDATALNFETNNTTRMTIDSTGNVGIGGAIVPAATLHTQTSGAKTSTTTGNYIENTATSSTGSINKVGLDIQSTGVWNGALANNIGLNVNVSGGTTNYAAIFQGGNVGIGTASPVAPLHVVKSGVPYLTSMFESNCAGCNARLSLWNSANAGASTASSLEFVIGPSGSSGIYASILGLSTNAINGALSFQTAINGLAIEKMRIDHNGNVGVGTTTPAEKFEVNGAIKVGNTVANNAGTIRWDGTNFYGYNGTTWQAFVPTPPASGACDTTVTYTSAGTYAYTVPAAFGTITIRLWGAGGGGGNGAIASGVSGSAGSASTVSSLGLSGGGGAPGLYGTGGAPNGSGGAGGAAVGGDINSIGSSGGNGSTGMGLSGSGGSAPGTGGSGGASVGGLQSGFAGAAPGGGGAGGAYTGSGGFGGGGGSGGYVEKTFTSAQVTPSTTISDIIVGSGGAGAVAGGTFSGGAGGAGRISITCVSTGAPPINDRSIVFQNSGNYGADANFVFTAAGNVGIGTATPQTPLQVEGVISPATNNAYTLGNASYRFTEVYATNGVINTSDQREKKDIFNTNLGLDFINRLRPVSYRWNTGVDSDTHYGLLAQETQKVISEMSRNQSTSLVSYDHTSDRYGVRYSELISPMIKAIQELYNKLLKTQANLSTLQQEMSQLKNENQAIKSYLCQKDQSAAICK